MKSAKSWLSLVMIGSIALFTPLALAGSAEDAAKASAEGIALLKKGNFEGAKKAFAAAAKADPEKAEYRQQFSFVSRVIKLRDGLAQEKSLTKWTGTARALRNFYLRQGLINEALDISKQMNEKLKTADSAVALAEVQLKAGKAADAIGVLSSLDPKTATPYSQAFLGLAYARDGKTAEAKKVAEKLVIPADADFNMLFTSAALYAQVGNSAKSISALTRSFEATPPSHLQAYKNVAQKSKDFASVAGTPEFEKALKTETKVKESGCSGGSDCSKCPSRGGCSGSKNSSCKEKN